jgi:hypothetical protein
VTEFGEVLFHAIRANAVCEFGLRVGRDVGFDIQPVPLVAANVLAPGTYRQKAMSELERGALGGEVLGSLDNIISGLKPGRSKLVYLGLPLGKSKFCSGADSR